MKERQSRRNERQLIATQIRQARVESRYERVRRKLSRCLNPLPVPARTSATDLEAEAYLLVVLHCMGTSSVQAKCPSAEHGYAWVPSSFGRTRHLQWDGPVDICKNLAGKELCDCWLQHLQGVQAVWALVIFGRDRSGL